MKWTPARHPRFGALAALVVVGLLTALAVPGPVAALQFVPDPTTIPAPPAPDPGPPPPPVPPPPDPSPHIRVLLARLGVIDAQRAQAAAQVAAAAARQALAVADQAVAVADQGEAAAQDRLNTARTDLGRTAAYAFMHATGGDLVSALQGDSTAGGRERELYDASVDHHAQVMHDAEVDLADAQNALGAAQAADDQAGQAVADQDAAVTAVVGSIAGAQHELATASADENVPPSAESWTVSIEGPTVFTPEELAQWYDAQGHGSQATVPVADLTRSYVEQGTAEGVRGDMAFAQSIHETGWFANNDTVQANNYAGIGHCDSCGGGFPFASADLGVLAQIQLLKSYAEPKPTYNLPRADKDLNGPAGCCVSWMALGGVWASDTGYGPHILAYYQQMLEWLVALRSAAP